MLNNCHLSVLVAEQAKRYGNKVAISFRDYAINKWVDITWNEFADKVRTLANALIALDVAPQERVAVFSQNKPECYILDFAAYADRAIVIPFYATSSEEQVRYMVDDAEIRYVFVGEQYQYDVAWALMGACKTLTRIIIFSTDVQRHADDHSSIYFHELLGKGEGFPHQTEVDKRLAEANEDDIANILYTSGTTGESKGVVLTYKMYHAAVKGNDATLPLSEKDVVLNFLPLTHVFERAWSYLCLAEGCHIAVNLRPADVLKSMQEVQPTCMCSVPRFWEKVYAGVLEKINNSGWLQRNLMHRALKVGRAYNVDYLLRKKKPPFHLSLEYHLYERTVIALLLRTLGLQHGNFFPTAGAAVPVVIEEFVHSVGINMMVGYGCTETTATVSNDHLDEPTSIGAVGRILPGVEVKIDPENSEILLKGDTITPCYYKKEEATKAAYTEDGWFRTGDAGYMKDGELFLTDRIKDLFKTSNGKYIAPQMLETTLVTDKFIDQIVLIADQRKFVSALVVPDYKQLEIFAHDHGFAYESREQLCALPQMVEMVMKRISALQKNCAYYEQVKRITLLPHPFSLERGELTNTLKVKRPVVNRNYANEIEKMYQQ